MYEIRCCLTSNLNHVKPADDVLVATVHGLQDAVVGTESGLGRDVAHAQKHLQDVGEAVGLVEVVGRTLVQRPLESVLVRDAMGFNSNNLRGPRSSRCPMSGIASRCAPHSSEE